MQAVRVKPHPNVVNVRFAHIMGFRSESEEYFCFEDFVIGRNLEEVVAEGKGELYNGTSAEVRGLLYPRPMRYFPRNTPRFFLQLVNRL